jgi:hypothetical protein
MKSKIITVSFSLLAFAACLLLPLSAASAQGTVCAVGSSARLPQGYSVNIRVLPDGGATRLDGMNSQSPAVTVLEIQKDTQGRDWYRIGEGRWVIGSFFVCTSPTATPTRTPTRTPTVAPRTATASPTRQPTSTAGASPTEVPILETAIAGEGEWVVVPFYCPKQCEGYIIVRNLP